MSDNGMGSRHTMSLLCHKEHQPLPLGDIISLQIAAELLLQFGKGARVGSLGRMDRTGEKRSGGGGMQGVQEVGGHSVSAGSEDAHCSSSAMRRRSMSLHLILLPLQKRGQFKLKCHLDYSNLM